MPKRKWACQTTEVTSPPVKRRTRGIIDSPIQEESQTDSDESHRTEQLLHRHSVTPPQKQPTHRPSTKRDSFSSASSACTTSPDLAYLGSASSEVESDVLQYSADTAVYYPGTDLVIDGWFQPCRSALAATVCNACKRNMYQAKVLCNRGCGAFTAGQVEVGSKVAPLCQR